jgi:ketosteroid isomerase-like protein
MNVTMNNERIVSEVQKFDEKWAAAEVRGDKTALDTMLTDDFVGVGPRGFVLTKSEWLDRHTSGDLKYDALNVDEIEVHPYGDAALVTSRQLQKGNYQSHDIQGQFRATQLLVRDGDRWRLASLHLSPIAGPPNWAQAEGR